jgi:sugar transferase (PEP-CTERM/EpsH1 system associated)
LVSDAEVGVYKRFCKNGNVVAVPNGVDLDYFKPQSNARESGCVFVGALDYFPNVDGVRWFCHEIWPQIGILRPGMELQLVGRRPGAMVRDLARIANVKVPGQVPDVRPYVANAAIIVVPLRIARGMQNKVLEAMAMAKAVIASPEALEGIDAIPGTHVLKASTPAEWVDAVCKLDGNPLLRRRLGDAARSFVEANHHWDRCLEPMSVVLGITTRMQGASC